MHSPGRDQVREKIALFALFASLTSPRLFRSRNCILGSMIKHLSNSDIKPGAGGPRGVDKIFKLQLTSHPTQLAFNFESATLFVETICQNINKVHLYFGTLWYTPIRLRDHKELALFNISISNIGC